MSRDRPERTPAPNPDRGRTGPGEPASDRSSVPGPEDLEVDLLLEAVFRRFGHDFRHYARATVKRRLASLLGTSGLDHVSDLIPRILHDPGVLDTFLARMSVPVTEMFRDPAFFAALREVVIPWLRTFPFVKVWHAGCATGEEVYSTAILFHEEGFRDRVHFYATDNNPRVLAAAAEGIYDCEQIRRYTASYQEAGGTESFADYYHGRYGSAKVRDDLKRNITFARHDLVTDRVFSEVNLVICRNVLIYFDSTLQERVLSLFSESLCHRGVLCLGAKESLDASSVAPRFRPLVPERRIYQKLA